MLRQPASAMAAETLGTLDFIVHFLHTEGLYAAEEALLREIENRFPDDALGDSPTPEGQSEEELLVSNSVPGVGDDSFEFGGAADAAIRSKSAGPTSSSVG